MTPGEWAEVEVGGLLVILEDHISVNSEGKFFFDHCAKKCASTVLRSAYELGRSEGRLEGIAEAVRNACEIRKLRGRCDS